MPLNAKYIRPLLLAGFALPIVMPVLAQVGNNSSQNTGPQTTIFGQKKYLLPAAAPYGSGQPYGYGFNTSGTPVPIGGNYYGFNVGSRQINYWHSTSGYYYPWSAGYAYPQQIVLYPGSSGEPAPSLPPVTTVFIDMQKFLDEEKGKGKLNDIDYQHLNRRLHDVMGMTSSNGYSESEIRKDIDDLGAEISHRLHS